LNSFAENPDLWNDSARAQKIMRERTQLDQALSGYREITSGLSDNTEMLKMAEAEGDGPMATEAENAIFALRTLAAQRELESLLSGEADGNDCYLEVNAGAGGTEAQDWAQMLLRMYVRWAEKNGYQVETMDLLAGDEAGIKSATILVTGVNAYGYLKSEKGVHRLVRISPFDASGRRHTSFAAVDVMPEIDDNVEIDINMNDIRVDTFRAGGAGGQHINKTDSAVRMTHIPTGIVAQCQSQRSQIKNREQCMKMLRARLFELEQQKQADFKTELGGDYQAIEWGSQIRSYVFHPYNMVKDHRTNNETGNVNAVMDGELASFIEAYLKQGK